MKKNKNKFETKYLAIKEIKAVAEDGTFEGLLSKYGNVDNGGDIVERGAFTKSLNDRGTTVPMLWQHKADTPIGEMVLDDREDGLYAKGKLLLDLADAKRAYILIKSNVVKGLSIGFRAIKDEVKDGIRHLKEIKLYEGSIVTFPMNEDAVISSVKAAYSDPDGDGDNDEDFDSELAQQQLMALPGQHMNALSSSLYTLFCDRDLQKKDKLEAFQTVLTQFSESFMGFLPEYIDAMGTGSSMYYYADGSLEVKRQLTAEEKAGARFSADTKTKLGGIKQKMVDLAGELQALTDDEAGDKSTSPSGEPPVPPTEPVEDHSGISQKLDDISNMFKNFGKEK